MKIIYFRDTPHHPHKPKYVSKEYVYTVMRRVTELLLDTFPGVLVLPCIGNHDYSPANQLPSRDDVYYGGMVDMWKPWFNMSDASDTMSQGMYCILICYERTRNREEWRTMTANVRNGYGT